MPDCCVTADKRGEARTAFTFTSTGNLLSIDEELCRRLQKPHKDLAGSPLSSIMTRYSSEMTMLFSRKAAKLGSAQNFSATFINGDRETVPAKLTIMCNMSKKEPCFDCKVSFEIGGTYSSAEDCRTEKIAALAALSSSIAGDSGSSAFDFYENMQVLDIGAVLKDCIKLTSPHGSNGVVINLIEDEKPFIIRTSAEHLKKLFINAILTAHAVVKDNAGEILIIAERNTVNNSIRIEIETCTSEALCPAKPDSGNKPASMPDFGLANIHRLLVPLRARFGIKSVSHGRTTFQIEFPSAVERQSNNLPDEFATNLNKAL